MKTFSSEPWIGSHKIVIGIDVGTSYSGVSFAYLYPGGPKAVVRVQQWPGQEAQPGESKIPSFIWYNGEQAMAFGASVMDPSMRMRAVDEEWQLAKDFKMHLHPKTIKEAHSIELTPLPDRISLQAIYRDFLAYLLQHTRRYFSERIIEGNRVWNAHFGSAEIIIAHPNGWGLKEQDFLRKAAIGAGLVTKQGAPERVAFVSEAEASVHFCLFHADLGAQLNVGTNFMVCDVGGSTIDATAYTVTSKSPKFQLKEIKPSACVQIGGVYVDAAFEKHLRSTLKKSSLASDDLDNYIDEGINDFEARAKRAFKDPEQTSLVFIGTPHKFSSSIGISGSRFALKGSATVQFFRPVLEEIILNIRDQLAGIDMKTVLLVGGFGDSPFIRDELRASLYSDHINVVSVNDVTSKAVSDGAVMFHATNLVVARAARFTYGISISEPFATGNPHHAGRPIKHDLDGEWMMNKWMPLVHRGDILPHGQSANIHGDQVFETAKESLGKWSQIVYAWTKEDEDEPYWISDRSGKPLSGFEPVCMVTADLSPTSNALKEVRADSEDAKSHWKVEHSIAIQFGGIELQAFLEWVDADDELVRTPAVIIPHSLV